MDSIMEHNGTRCRSIPRCSRQSDIFNADSSVTNKIYVNPTAVRCHLLQLCPSMPSFVFAFFFLKELCREDILLRSPK